MLTRSQRRILEDAIRNGGKIDAGGVRSQAGGARRRMLERMRDNLLVEGPPWQITGLGEDALTELWGNAR